MGVINHQGTCKKDLPNRKVLEPNLRREDDPLNRHHLYPVWPISLLGIQSLHGFAFAMPGLKRVQEEALIMEQVIQPTMNEDIFMVAVPGT